MSPTSQVKPRNFEGFYQYYETYELHEGTFNYWVFYVCGFSFCNQYANLLMFDGTQKAVPIDEDHRILVGGTWYGPEHWNH